MSLSLRTALAYLPVLVLGLEQRHGFVKRRGPVAVALATSEAEGHTPEPALVAAERVGQVGVRARPRFLCARMPARGRMASLADSKPHIFAPPWGFRLATATLRGNAMRRATAP
jgi:hypothetical protein